MTADVYLIDCEQNDSKREQVLLTCSGKDFDL